MFQVLLAALGAFIGLNVHSAASRKYYDADLDGNDFKYFMGACFHVLIISSCIILLIILPIRNFLAEWLGLQPQWILWAIVVSAASFIVNMRLGQWQVRKQAKRYGLLLVMQSLLNMLLSVVLVVVLLKGADGRIEGQVYAVTVAAFLAMYFMYKDRLVSFFNWNPAYIKEALAYGVPLIPHVVGAFLLLSVDRFVINAELGLAQAGIYLVAVQFSLIASLVFDAINKAYVPWLFELLQRDQAVEKRQVVKYTYLYFVAIIFMAGVAFLVGPLIVTLVAGAKYAQAGELIGWLVLGQSFRGMYLAVTNYIFYSKKTGVLSLITLCCGLVNVFLLFVGIYFFGVIGAAMAFSAAMAIQFLTVWLFAAKLHPMPWMQPFWK